MKFTKTSCYILALTIIVIWSSTFISTKVLLDVFTPIEILIYRFALAWVFMFVAYPRVHRPESLKMELTIAAAGVAGGSLYFVAENYALHYSLASNVSLLVSTAPIMTAVLAHFFLQGERLKRRTISGALVAFAGAALVIFNGKFVLKLNPLGDCLALASSLSWAVYSIIVRRLNSAHSPLYVTRKIFFYTLVTVLPLTFFSPLRLDFTPLLQPKYAINLLFLTLFASCLAYVVWNAVIRFLGATKANNLIYFIPLLTLVGSALILGEPLTPFALAGAALIFAGVYITSGVKA
jgi:drug/metabolite transporter (DMT)-like permease